VRAGAENGTLQFTIHWNGGTHTQLEMERPRSATETTTPKRSSATLFTTIGAVAPPPMVNIERPMLLI